MIEFASRLKDIRTDVGSPGRKLGMGAIAVVHDAHKSMVFDPPEPVLDGPLAIICVSTEPGIVSWRGIPEISDVRVGLVCILLGSSGGGDKHHQVAW